VTIDAAGDLVGTANVGGAIHKGMVWAIKNGTYYDLHDFGANTVLNANTVASPDGNYPTGQLAFDASGSLRGTTTEGGECGSPNGGILWRISGSNYLYEDMHDFGGPITDASGNSSTDGYNPQAGVTFDYAGNAYGTATYGGPGIALDHSAGIVWKMSDSGGVYKYEDIHDFGATITYSKGHTGKDAQRR
jgi:hypothetical protein